MHQKHYLGWSWSNEVISMYRSLSYQTTSILKPSGFSSCIVCSTLHISCTKQLKHYNFRRCHHYLYPNLVRAKSAKSSKCTPKWSNPLSLTDIIIFTPVVCHILTLFPLGSEIADPGFPSLPFKTKIFKVSRPSYSFSIQNHVDHFNWKWNDNFTPNGWSTSLLLKKGNMYYYYF